MFINPKIAIEKGWIKGIKDPDKQIQPNAIDFTLDHVFTINTKNSFHISEAGKQMRGGYKLEPVPARRVGLENEGDEYWHLAGESVYDGMSDVYITVPEGVAVLPLIVRSTFNRNGIFITSGLYDSGYEGHLGFIIHNRLAEAFIGTGTRIGQVAFVESENAGMYAGGWNHEEGTHYSE